MEDRKIKSFIFLITYDCNLRCSYCYEPKTHHCSATFESAKSIIEKALSSVEDKYDAVEIQFMGGEPLVCFDLIKRLSEWLWDKPFTIPIEGLSAPTNGTLLNDEMRQWFIDNRDRFSLQLSFDGDRLMQNINRSNSAPLIDIDFFARYFPNEGVKMTVSPETINDFSRGVRFLHGKGFNLVAANLALGNNLGWEQKHLVILQDELQKLIDFYYENDSIRPIPLLDLPVLNILDENPVDTSCKCGRDLFCYDIDGQVYPCHIFSPITISRSKAKQAQQFDFEAIQQSEETVCDKCILKNVCVNCIGMNYKDYGNCKQRSPFDCAQYKLFFLASCVLQKKIAYKKNDIDKLQLINGIINLLTKK